MRAGLVLASAWVVTRVVATTIGWVQLLLLLHLPVVASLCVAHHCSLVRLTFSHHTLVAVETITPAIHKSNVVNKRKVKRCMLNAYRLIYQ